VAIEEASLVAQRAVRNKTLKEAKIVLRDWSTIDCLLRNVSETGARLEFGNPVALPDTFQLLIKSRNTLVPVRLVWERGASAGVSFTGPEKPVPPRKL
jgi:hypothetical protein